MIKYNNQRMTANQVAKELLIDKLDIALEFWTESCFIDLDKMTDKEKQDIQNQLVKRANGILKYLGFNPYYK